MKAKIFAKLKQEYSALGLGDDVLMSRAEALNAIGLVNDENIDAVIAVQRKDLEEIQKRIDKRVTDALEKERKKNDDEAKEAEAKKKAKAEAEAKAAEEKRAADEEAKRKEEAEKQRNEEQKRKDEELAVLKEAGASDAVIAYLKKLQLDNENARKSDVEAIRKQMQEEMEKRVSESARTSEASTEALQKTITELMDKNASLQTGYEELKRVNEEAQKVKSEQERQNFIATKAKELGVPQWRVDEGFVFADNATEDSIVETLTNCANNLRTQLLPGTRTLGIPEDPKKVSQDEIESFAKSIIK